jgi:hypothetical protein
MADNPRVAAAKKAMRDSTSNTYSKNLGGPTSKADNIIYREALRAKDAGRNTGATVQTVKNGGNTTIAGNSGTKVRVIAEGALAKAARVSAQTGENVQNIRSRMKTDMAKTASRAANVESRNKKKVK